MAEKRAASCGDVGEQKKYMAEVRAWNERYLAENGVRRRAFVLTLGCQQNEADSEKLAGMAQEMGYEITDRPDDGQHLRYPGAR